MAKKYVTKLTKDIKHEYFSEQNIKIYPERMIIVGFIAADGCIRQGKTGQKMLMFNIAEKDKLALDIINNEIAEGKRNLSFLKNTKSCMLSFPSDNICKDLEKYNIVERKSNIYDLPKNLTDLEMQYFLKGYFYGDGCINEQGVFLMGTPMFSYNLKEYLENKKIIDYCNVYKMKNHECKQIRIVGRMASKFSNYLFFDNKFILLPRKNKIIKDITYNTWLTDEDIYIIKYNDDLDKISKLIGKSIESIKSYKGSFKTGNIKSKRVKEIFNKI